MRAIFRMGVPVSGKNLFPSNIQGLPTWYEIRVNKDGHVARARRYDVMVAMNGQTYESDIAEVVSGGYTMYDSSWPLDRDLIREDVTYLGVPLAEMCNDAFRGPRERILMKNIACAGALVAMLGLDMEVIAQLLTEQFAGKDRLRESNQTALRLGYDFAAEHFDYPLPCRIETMDATRGSILIDGNTAAALGCVYAGATVAAWYPITPSTSLMDAFAKYCAKFRRDPDTGQNNYLVLQAEDELAAIGMVLGASWAGARAFTSTSGPGISLMQELLGMGYYAEVPAVIFDVQRTGPSTGMPTRVQQSDILSCAYASHGDTKHVLLFPRNPAECFSMARDRVRPRGAFPDPRARALRPRHRHERLGQPRAGVGRRLRPRSRPRARRRRVARARGLPSLRASGPPTRSRRARSPVSASSVHISRADRGTAATARTPKLPSNTRRWLTGWRASTRRSRSTSPRRWSTTGTRAARDPDARQLRARRARGDRTPRGAQGVVADYMRVRGFPFGAAVRAFLDAHETIVVVEQNRDAQLRTLLTLETPVPKEKLESVLVYGGYPLSAEDVVDGVTRDRGGLNDAVHRQTRRSPIPASNATRSGSPSATTRAGCRRCARAAATTR